MLLTVDDTEWPIFVLIRDYVSWSCS